MGPRQRMALPCFSISTSEAELRFCHNGYSSAAIRGEDCGVNVSTMTTFCRV
jgi:hypothetical protein